MVPYTYTLHNVFQELFQKQNKYCLVWKLKKRSMWILGSKQLIPKLIPLTDGEYGNCFICLMEHESFCIYLVVASK